MQTRIAIRPLFSFCGSSNGISLELSVQGNTYCNCTKVRGVLSFEKFYKQHKAAKFYNCKPDIFV